MKMCRIEGSLHVGETLCCRGLGRSGRWTHAMETTSFDGSDSTCHEEPDNFSQRGCRKVAPVMESHRCLTPACLWQRRNDDFEKRQTEDLDAEWGEEISDEDTVELVRQTTDDTTSDEEGLIVPPAPRLNPREEFTRRISFFELPPPVLAGSAGSDALASASPVGAAADPFAPAADPSSPGRHLSPYFLCEKSNFTNRHSVSRVFPAAGEPAFAPAGFSPGQGCSAAVAFLERLMEGGPAIHVAMGSVDEKTLKGR